MFPSELKALDPKLGQAIELIALYLGGKGQEGDGGFRDLINHPQAQGRSLETSIQGMDALSEAYTAKPTLLMKIRLREGWKFITKLFGSGTVPHPNETFAQTMVAPHVLWKLVNLWDRSQSLIRGSVGTSVDWATLESRIEVLRRVLADQIQSDHGPEALLEGSHL